ncbi:metalloregulator ArsR/SmtB family transcription factor [Kribbella sp. NBC_01245]|uniref:ArsR/SmtB family transcription factor n=1 Tax=Kribbella sp. NBC_01245 TaxID=2903578 RepID=UPI002E28FE76|nr:metalloregulator ArsR/SmtB family transcription factor [Kribbella sp. NBC_01245]
MDEVFKALADPTRRALLDSLNEHNGQTLSSLCASLDLTRQAVSKHLAVLEAAGLIATVRSGREKFHHLNAEPINAIADRWINRYDKQRVQALADLKIALEQPMTAPEFVYVSYIKTTPEKLWQALTEPAFTEQYWGVTLDSDWKPGSTVTFTQAGVTIEDPEQVVLEAEPGKRLSYTWHTFTPEFGKAFDFDDEWIATAAAEPRSKVTFDLEPSGDLVKLAVTHDAFPPGSVVLASVSQGWPHLLSSLKSLLETGHPLPEPA